jgi:hypothetical protein
VLHRISYSSVPFAVPASVFPCQRTWPEDPAQPGCTRRSAVASRNAFAVTNLGALSAGIILELVMTQRTQVRAALAPMRQRTERQQA